MPRISIAFVLFISCILITKSHSQNLSLYFDGEDDFVQIDGNIFNNMDSLTISAWIKGEPGGMIISNHTHGTYWESVELSSSWFIINSSNSDASRQILQFGNVGDSMWHHIAAVWSAQALRIYLDGQPHDSSITAINSPWISPALNAIGGRISTAEPPASAEFSGYIDEVSVWNKPLRQDQIVHLMNHSPTVNYYGASDSGLVAYWNFNETEGDTAFDLTSNNYFGIIYGAVRSEEVAPLAIEKNYNTRVLPDSWTLNQNYPNPFNPTTKITFNLPVSETVQLQVYNSLGQLISTLVDDKLPAGSHEVKFSAYSLPSGVYFYRLRVGNYLNTKKMLLIR